MSNYKELRQTNKTLTNIETNGTAANVDLAQIEINTNNINSNHASITTTVNNNAGTSLIATNDIVSNTTNIDSNHTAALTELQSIVTNSTNIDSNHAAAIVELQDIDLNTSAAGALYGQSVIVEDRVNDVKTNTANIDANHTAALTELQSIVTNTAVGSSFGFGIELRNSALVTDLSKFTPFNLVSHGDVNTSNSIIIPALVVGDGSVAAPGTSRTMYFNSDNIADDPTLAGARTILIKGIDSAGVDSQETLNLNGTGTVSTVNSYCNINSVTVTVTGASNENEGVIQCYSDAGGVTGIHGAMDIGANLMRFSHVHIASADVLFLTSMVLMSPTLTAAITAKFKGSQLDSTDIAYELFDVVQGLNNGSLSVTLEGSPGLAGDTVFIFRGKTSAGTEELSFLLQGYLFRA